MEDDDIGLGLRERLKLLNARPDDTIFNLKPSKPIPIDLKDDGPNPTSTISKNHGSNCNDPSANKPLSHRSHGAKTVSLDDSLDSDLPDIAFEDVLSKKPDGVNKPFANESMQNLTTSPSQHETSSFTLKDLKAIAIDLTSDVEEENFTQIKDSPPKTAPKRPIPIEDSASNSSDSLPPGIFRNSLKKSPESTSNQDSKDICYDLQSAIGVLKSNLVSETRVDGPTAPKKARPSTTVSDKKLQAKLKAEEKERQKLERQKEREAKKQEKERAAQIRKAQQMSRKAFQPKECLKHMSVILDSTLLSIPGFETTVLNVCETLGSTCVVQSQQMPFVMSWRRSVIECDMAAEVVTAKRDNDEDEILVCLPLDNFVQLVFGAKQKQRGEFVDDSQTLQGYIENVRLTYFGCLVTLVVIGMENYFRKTKNSKSKKANQKANPIVSRLDVEEALVNLNLRNLCNCQLIDTIDEMTDIVRTFTKAVAEKPMKKDRLQSEFSFHAEKGGGIGTDTQSLWKAQLEQFKNISNDVSSAIVSQFPSPKFLFESYKKCSTESECIKLLENIMIRRKAGVLESSRRVGKEAARRIYLLMTTSDPELVLK